MARNLRDELDLDARSGKTKLLKGDPPCRWRVLVDRGARAAEPRLRSALKAVRIRKGEVEVANSA